MKKYGILVSTAVAILLISYLSYQWWWWNTPHGSSPFSPRTHHQIEKQLRQEGVIVLPQSKKDWDMFCKTSDHWQCADVRAGRYPESNKDFNFWRWVEEL